jgi:hypothetical protein
MSRKLPGHDRCLICHPDLNKKWAKNNGKGLMRLRHSVAEEMQESTRLLDILARAEQETIADDENN